MIGFHEFLKRRWVQDNAALLIMGGSSVPNLTPREPGCFFGEFFLNYFGDFFGTVV